VRKNVSWRGLVQYNSDLIVSLHDTRGKIWNAQRILPKKDSIGNDKYFLEGGRVKGCYHSIGFIRPICDEPILLCEGFATGLTLYRVFRYPVACAIQANNLPNVAWLLRRKFEHIPMIIAADFDHWTFRNDRRPEGVMTAAYPGDAPEWITWRREGRLQNPGLDYALKAAQAAGASVQTLPPGQFGRHPSKPTDFNDMAAIAGDQAIRDCFAKVLS
jgi:putative DNA primase/helicase